MEKQTLLTACRNFFFKDVRSSEILQEMKKLTPKDREDLTLEFAKVGVEIIAPAA